MNELNENVKKVFMQMIREEEKVDYDYLLSYSFFLLATCDDEFSLQFAYSIIINYSLQTKDYSALYEISLILGFSPIISILRKLKYSPKTFSEEFIGDIFVDNNTIDSKILTAGQKIIYRLINEKMTIL